MLIACVDTVHKDSLTKRLNDQRKDGAFCDVLLKVSGRTLPTHSCVLSACSPFFRQLIVSDRNDARHLTTSGSPTEIDLDLLVEVGPLVSGAGLLAGVGLEAVVGLVDYIYTGKINLRRDGVELVVQLAEAFMLDSLSALIRNYVRNASTGTEPAMKSEPAIKPNRTTRNRPVVITLPVRRRRKVPPRKLLYVTERLPTAPSIRLLRKRPLPARKLAKEDRGLSDSASGSDEEEEEDCPNTVVAVKRVKRLPLRPVVGSARSSTVFKCKQCSFVSRDGRAVRTHKLQHPGLQYSCRGCAYVTGQCSELLVHLLGADHPQSRCGLCEFESEDVDVFRKHVERHDPHKPFFCLQCEFKCGSRSQLTAHTMKHSTERPFICSVCSRGFKWKKGLQTHMLSHTKEKAFMCDQCDFRTAYSSVLAMHLRIHNGEMLSCPHDGCNFQAYSKRHIAKHGLTHNKDKPYVCEVCGQKYAQIESLRRHSKVHNPDTKTLSCNLCQYTTTRRDKMTEHTKKSHSTDRPAKPSADRLPRNKPTTKTPPRTETTAATNPRRYFDMSEPRSEHHQLAATKLRISESPLDGYTTGGNTNDSLYLGAVEPRSPQTVRGNSAEYHHHATPPKRSSHHHGDVTPLLSSREQHYHLVKSSGHHHHHYEQQQQQASNQRVDHFVKDGGGGGGSVSWADTGDSGSGHHFLSHHHHHHHQRESSAAVAAMFVTTHLGLMDMVHP